MKRLAIFLFGICLLASCDEIEEARTLPKEFSIGDITDISELTYDELENLVINSNYYDPVYQKDEMRRNGGLIIKGQVTLGTGEAYSDARLWFSTRESDLPTSNSDMWNGNYAGALTASANTPYFFQNNQQLTESGNAPTYYYKLGLSTWDKEYPGFVDNCLDGGYYSQTVFSSVKTYTRPDVPCLFECMMGGEVEIIASFSVKSNHLITEGGICYSRTNQLPTIKDEVEYYDNGIDQNWKEGRIYINAYPGEAGTYYVRAFASSGTAIGYSPVWKVTTYNKSL